MSRPEPLLVWLLVVTFFGNGFMIIQTQNIVGEIKNEKFT